MALQKRTPGAAPTASPSPATTTAAAAPAPSAETSATTAKFEESPAETTAAPAAPTPAAAPAAPTKALVIKTPQAVALMQQGHAVLDSMRDCLRVDWDTLTRLKMAQGRISMEPNINFGEYIDFQLMSYQDNYLISPGSDTPEAKELAKYSDDGRTIKDTGEDCQAYIKRLNEMGYDKARMGKRVILVASMLDCDKDVDADVVDGMLFQIDLPPTSRQAFERYKNQTAFDISRGKVQSDQAVFVRMTVHVEQQRGNKSNEYTVASFKLSPAAAQFAANAGQTA